MAGGRIGREAGGRSAAVGAGIGACVFFAFAPLPVQVAVSAHMGLSADEASRWIFVVWATGAIASIVLSIRARQPISITWSVLGLVYLGSVAHGHSFAELVGANLVAGVAILALALLGVGERVMRLVPLPIVVGMFAGSILQYMTGAVEAVADDVLVAGSAGGAYLAARAVGARRVPPVAVAAAVAVAATCLCGRLGPVDGALSAPALGPAHIAFSLDTIVTVSPTLVVFALALGNVQGLGYLEAQGFRPPANAVSIAVGTASIVNALGGGHQASVGRATTALVAGPDAGPAEGRYVASLVASAGALAVAVGAAAIVAFVGALPASAVAVVTGLAVLPAFQDALGRALSSALPTGALAAFLVAATPFQAAGIGSSSWALLAGLVASLATERQGLAQWMRGGRRGGRTRAPLDAYPPGTVRVGASVEEGSAPRASSPVSTAA